MGMMDCVECGFEFEQVSENRFCSYRCERRFKFRFMMDAYVNHLHGVASDNRDWSIVDKYFAMSQKEQREAARAWKKSLRG